MLCAVAEDFARVPGCHVTVSWDRRLGAFSVPAVTVVSPDGPEDERRVLVEQAAAAERTLVIAPEFHDLLAERSEAVLAAGGTLLGSAPEVARRCGDKLGLSRLLTDRSPRPIPHIRTFALSHSERPDDLPYPIVIKPRCGAGSTNTFLIRSAAELSRRLREPFDPQDLPPDVWQPYVRGRALSVACLVHPSRADGAPADVDVFPVGEQRLSDDGRFAYRGGVIPAHGIDAEPIRALVLRLIECLGQGMRGYVGFDVLVPDDEPTQPLLVEINPRLTTSYLGYRALTEENLAARMLPNVRTRGDVTWNARRIEFDAATSTESFATPKDP